MRLLEIAPNFTMSTAGTLLTILQHLKDKIGDGSKVPMDAISALMRNVGYNFTYDDFKNLFDNNQDVKSFVSNFNEKEITLGKSDDTEPAADSSLDTEKIVDNMAKSAAKEINK
jgi:hypothetical protein